MQCPDPIGTIHPERNNSSVASSSALSGVFPVLQTPFNSSGRIDEATLRREIGWVTECGADGVAVAMVSEILRLNDAERRELAELVCSMAAGHPTVVSVGAESTRLAVSLAEHAQSVGAAAVMATPPLSVTVPEDELVRYYDAIAAATDLPLIVQDASGIRWHPHLDQRSGEPAGPTWRTAILQARGSAFGAAALRTPRRDRRRGSRV